MDERSCSGPRGAMPSRGDCRSALSSVHDRRTGLHRQYMRFLARSFLSFSSLFGLSRLRHRVFCWLYSSEISYLKAHNCQNLSKSVKRRVKLSASSGKLNPSPTSLSTHLVVAQRSSSIKHSFNTKPPQKAWHIQLTISAPLAALLGQPYYQLNQTFSQTLTQHNSLSLTSPSPTSLSKHCCHHTSSPYLTVDTPHHHYTSSTYLITSPRRHIISSSPHLIVNTSHQHTSLSTHLTITTWTNLHRWTPANSTSHHSSRSKTNTDII